jgi:hypothetical protein
MPVVAAINFSGVKWTATPPSFGALFGKITSSSTASETAITFTLNNGQTFAVGKTTVVSSALPARGSEPYEPFQHRLQPAIQGHGRHRQRLYVQRDRQPGRSDVDHGRPAQQLRLCEDGGPRPPVHG